VNRQPEAVRVRRSDNPERPIELAVNSGHEAGGGWSSFDLTRQQARHTVLALQAALVLTMPGAVTHCPDSHHREEPVLRTPDTVRAVGSPDGRRPILVQADHARADVCGWGLTVTQAWELIGDLQALVARHPAPTMPTRGMP
jgi:hypothetical protein